MTKHIVLKNGINKFKMNLKIEIYILSLITLFVLFSCKSRDPSIVVVPENFTGYILIIHGQENGVKKEYKNKSRVYRIPENGVLLSKFEDNPGRSRFTKFFQGNISTGNEILFIGNIEDMPKNKICAFGGSSGFRSRDKSGKDGIRFVQYFIGTENQIRESIKELDTIDIINLIE